MELTARKEPRKTLALALELDDGKTRRGRIGVSRNISRSGLLVNTPSQFTPGTRVSVRVHTFDGGVTTFDAEVARVEECGPKSQEPWRYKIGLRFRGARFLNFGVHRKSASLMKASA